MVTFLTEDGLVRISLNTTRQQTEMAARHLLSTGQ